jgi:sec-independent protein translocase protein TatA
MPIDFSLWQIAIVLVIGLLVFGPKKLPELGRGLGSGLRDFRKGLSGEAEPEPTQPVVVQSTAPIVETATSAAPAEQPVAASAEPVAEPVAAETPAPEAEAGEQKPVG